MSFDISLREPKNLDEYAALPELVDARGGVYQIGGTDEAWLNVTYNYAPHYFRVLDSERGIRVLGGMTGEVSIPRLNAAIAQLGQDVSADYWEPTEGNARKALETLRSFAEMRPDAIWKVN